MHELSVAQAVLGVVLGHAEGRRVTRVEVQVGHLRQVVPSALEFAFTLVSEGTEAEGAELVIEHVPARGRCRACDSETVMREFPLQCARCGGLDVSIVAGEELLVSAIEVEAEAELTTEGIAHGC